MSRSARKHSEGTLNPGRSPQRPSADFLAASGDETSRHEIQDLAINILSIFTFLHLVELERREKILNSFAEFITAVDGLKFTDGNNYKKAASLIPDSDTHLPIATHQASLIQLLKLFTDDSHLCCFSFKGKGGTSPTSFKTFLGILLGVDFSFEPTETDADRKKLIYDRLVILHATPTIGPEIRRALANICADNFFKNCRPKAVAKTSILMAGFPGAACGSSGLGRPLLRDVGADPADK